MRGDIILGVDNFCKLRHNLDPVVFTTAAFIVLWGGDQADFFQHDGFRVRARDEVPGTHGPF